jgi:small subunit ribosomal protein S20
MAITLSAKKAIRQNKKRRTYNLVYINKMKSLIKDMKALVVAKKTKEAQEMLPKVYQILDKAAKVGIIKKNNASRRKSRLTKMIDKATK